MLTLSAYTANLASFLVVQADQHSGFSSLDSAVAQQSLGAVSEGS